MNHDTLANIFRILARERLEKADEFDEAGLVLDYESFNKALIMIAIEGREILGGSLKPKMENDVKYTTRYKISTRGGRSRITNRSSSQSPKRPVAKTLESKRIKELESKKPKYETEIKDIKVRKTFDVSSISKETLDSLLIFAEFSKR